ncbi:MAG: hypothetical protein F6J98_27065 [Moorea sp. SIO4G2]|nr:hypothetical protein [Moorena sp. SIO4G2]
MGRWGDGEMGRWGDGEMGSQISKGCVPPLLRGVRGDPYFPRGFQGTDTGDPHSKQTTRAFHQDNVFKYT